jgi:hypothetical protein
MGFPYENGLSSVTQGASNPWDAVAANSANDIATVNYGQGLQYWVPWVASNNTFLQQHLRVLRPCVTQGDCTGNGWARSSTLAAIDIGANAAGTLYAVGTNNSVYQYSPSSGSWSGPVGSLSTATRIAVDTSGLPFAIDSSGSVWHYSGSSWSRVSGAPSSVDLDVDTSNDLWVVDTSGVVHESQSGTWTSYGGSGSRIAVDASLNPWIIDKTSGQLEMYSGSQFVGLGGSGIVDLAIDKNDGTAWIVGSDNLVFFVAPPYVSPVLFQSLGQNSSSVTAGPGGFPWATETSSGPIPNAVVYSTSD